MKNVSNLDNVSIANETSHDAEEVEHLSAIAFGPGRFARTAFRLREGVEHEPSLSFIARDEQGGLIGSVRLTKILVDGRVALLLGPLVVSAQYKNKGVGAMLMRSSIDAATVEGYPLILLVGDLPYYERFGFQIVPPGKIDLPAPVARNRLLFCELSDGAVAEFSGLVARYHG